MCSIQLKSLFRFLIVNMKQCYCHIPYILATTFCSAFQKFDSNRLSSIHSTKQGSISAIGGESDMGDDCRECHECN